MRLLYLARLLLVSPAVLSEACRPRILLTRVQLQWRMSLPSIGIHKHRFIVVPMRTVVETPHHVSSKS